MPGVELTAELVAENDPAPKEVALAEREEFSEAALYGLAPGRYRVTVRTVTPSAALLPVSAVFEVAG